MNIPILCTGMGILRQALFSKSNFPGDKVILYIMVTLLFGYAFGSAPPTQEIHHHSILVERHE